jgi:hypothetical protein
MSELKVKEELVRFDAAVKAKDGPGISNSLAALDGLLAAHRGDLHPQLVHFLEGRSYAKALAYLGATSGFAKPSSPPGGCGGGGHRH